MAQNRDEYLQRCKDRALQCLPNCTDAIASIMSDLRQHPDFTRVADNIAPLAIHYALKGDVEDARRFILGFR